MVQCYLCNKDAEGKYCFYCRRPICDDHAKWQAGKRHFAYCPLCNSVFYKPLEDFCDSLKTYAQEHKITDKKTEIILSVIKRVIDKLTN